MSDNTGRVHWSFWVIGVIALIWNGMGVMNFFMQMNAEMVAAMPESYRAIIEARPVWVTGAFAIAVFGGTLGCLLLLFKKSVAYCFFVVSLIGAIVQIVPTLEIGTVSSSIGFGTFIAVAVFLIWYSKFSRSKAWIS